MSKKPLTPEQIEELAIKNAENFGAAKDIFHPELGWLMRNGEMTPAAVELLKPKDAEIDTEYTDDLVCPHCGHADSDSWEHYLDSDGETAFTCCEYCGLSFKYTQHISMSFTSHKEGKK